MTNDLYKEKQAAYFGHTRHDIISLVPRIPGQRILEIGAADGNTLRFLKSNGYAAEVMGVELCARVNPSQQDPIIDKFQLANVETDAIDAGPGYFDVIICADILEHLADPWATVDKLSGHLKRGGILIASIPNIREWRSMASLVFKGEFNYDPAGGVMDSTHLRFFCKKNMKQLLSRAGLQPVYCKPSFLLKEVKEGWKRRMINRASFGLLQDLLAVQYLLVAKLN